MMIRSIFGWISGMCSRCGRANATLVILGTTKLALPVGSWDPLRWRALMADALGHATLPASLAGSSSLIFGATVQRFCRC